MPCLKGWNFLISSFLSWEKYFPALFCTTDKIDFLSQYCQYLSSEELYVIIQEVKIISLFFSLWAGINNACWFLTMAQHQGFRERKARLYTMRTCLWIWRTYCTHCRTQPEIQRFISFPFHKLEDQSNVEERAVLKPVLYLINRFRGNSSYL